VSATASIEVSEPRDHGREDRALLDRLADWTVAARGPGFGWSFVAVAFVAATALRMALHPYLPAGFPFLTYFPAVALTAFIAGSRAGAVLGGLCLLASWYLFIPPFSSFAVEPAHGMALALYLVVVGTEVALVFLMRRALRRMTAAEALAREQARSRTLMFHELQHRVSNNLAVVGSLLQLQRREVGDPDAAHALEVAVARVNVVSRLNRLLHNPDAQAVDFGAFLRAVVPDAVTAAGTDERVRVSVAAEPVVVPGEKAIPLGLVATELLANALEHGFPDGRRGRVEVTLRGLDGCAVLEIRDDGVGLPDGFELERSRSLGLQIALQFAGQLHATLSIETDGGVVSRLEVPLG
jgi:two-component sensor histidine kinase